jgi:hypothetical protein
MRTTQTTARSYTLLDHTITVRGAQTVQLLPARLDALLGPSDPPEKRRSSRGTQLALARTPVGWYLSAEDEATAGELLTDEADVARQLECRAYRAAVRRGRLPLVLHGGAVARAGCAILLPNVSGAGKSTLTLALAARGWLPLTDDVCPLIERGEELVAIGCRRCCHLSEASQVALRGQGIELEGPVGALAGYFRPLRWGEPAPVWGIVVPRYIPNAPTSFGTITQAECLGQLATMMFEQESPSAQDRRCTAARLAARTPAYALTYSSLDEALDVFETLVTRLDTANMANGHHLAPDVPAIT